MLVLRSAVHSSRKAGCPSEVCLRSEWLAGRTNDCVGRPIWITQQEQKRHHLWGCVTLESLEEIIEGADVGDYIGTVDLTRSFRIGAKIEIGLKHSELSHSVVDCPNTLHEEACRLAFECSPILFKSPVALTRAPLSSGSLGFAQSRARFLATTASHNHDLHRLGRWNKVSNLSGIGASVFAHIENECSEISYGRRVELAAEWDPVLRITHPQTVSRQGGQVRERLDVDLAFVDLNPECVVARKFVASSAPDLAQSLLKTEAAEETHQAVVRYIAAGLGMLKICAKQTRSIDLFAATRGGNILFEVKSANAGNAMAQFSAGAVQLHAYALAYEDVFGCSAVKVLVMQSLADDNTLSDLLTRLAKSLRIHLLFCDTAQPWPSGLRGLRPIIDTGV